MPSLTLQDNDDDDADADTFCSFRKGLDLLCFGEVIRGLLILHPVPHTKVEIFQVLCVQLGVEQG